MAAISVPVLGGLFIETILAAKLSPGRPIQLAAKIGLGDPGIDSIERRRRKG